MSIGFKHHDTLRLFLEVAQHNSFSDAAIEMNMTKGAISYQVKTLEAALGLVLFERNARGVELTNKGRQLQNLCIPHFENIERDLNRVTGHQTSSLTVGMSSYFASRWLSARLMSFMQLYPAIQLRIQPMTQLFDLERQGVDLAIRWGNGEWNDVKISPFMPLPAWPVGDRKSFERVQEGSLMEAFSEFTLLRDHDDSNAWSHWFDIADLPHQTRSDTLIIPDPNVRVQSVINGQGIALMDSLVASELESGALFRLSSYQLASYGYYLAIPHAGDTNENVDVFVDWLLQQ